MNKLIKKHLFIVLAVIVAFLLPFFVLDNSSITYAVGENCTAAGRPGVCRTRGTTACSTYYHSGVCPGGANNQCCINSPVACHPVVQGVTLSGFCHNSSGGNTYNCTGLGGTWYSNYCPQTPSDVRCCVLPTPTSTPTPTVTPTPTITPTPTPTPVTLPPAKGSTTTPGIIFTGDGTADFGSGQSSTKGWVVGGADYPEVFSQSVNPSPISYQRLFDKANQAKLPKTNLTTYSDCTDLTNCTLPAGLEHGIYIADATQAGGTLSLNAHTFLPDRDYIFLIKGNLKIVGNIITPAGSTVLFAVSNDVIIDRTVSAAANSYPLPAGQVQAIFDAGSSFIVDGIGDCATGTDKMLNIEGAIVTNTGVGLAGTFENLRDLCSFNATIPSVTIKPRLDFLLNAPEFIMITNTTFRETP